MSIRLTTLGALCALTAGTAAAQLPAPPESPPATISVRQPEPPKKYKTGPDDLIFDFAERSYAVVNAQGLTFRIRPVVHLARGAGGAARIGLVDIESVIDSASGVEVNGRHYEFDAFDGELWRLVQGAKVTELNLRLLVDTPGRPSCQGVGYGNWAVRERFTFPDCPVNVNTRIRDFQVASMNNVRADLNVDLAAKVKQLEAGSRQR